MKIGLIQTFFPYILCNINFLQKFISNLEISQNLNSIFIFKNDNFQYIDEIIKELFLPKITIQNGFQLNTLNFPKYQTINSLKYYFNREFMTIIFAENGDENILENGNLKKIIWHNRKQIIIFITEKFYNNSKNLLRKFRQNHFINVIFLDIESFSKTQKFQTFTVFPFQIVEKSNFKKESISNVNKKVLNVDCKTQYPYTKCYQKDNKILGIGRTFHIIKNFIHFINGTSNFLIGKSYDLETSIGPHQIDLWTKIEVLKLIDYLQMYPLSSEVLINTFEQRALLIIVPKSVYISSVLYIIKPFSLQLWILCIGYILYTSTALSIALYITKRDLKFWKIFDHILRTLISQPFDSPLYGIPTTIVYVLAIILGFIMTNFYTALLGSFLTTYIQEFQISSLSDLKKSNLKLLHSTGKDIELTSGFHEIADMVSYLPYHEDLQIFQSANKSYAHTIFSDIWEESPLFHVYFKIRDFYLEFSYASLMLQLNSIYKDRLHRFIYIIQDTGLYEFWKRSFKLEDYIFYGKPKPLKKYFNTLTSNRRVLDLNYFVYPFVFLAGGLACGISAFLMEVVYKRF